MQRWLRETLLLLGCSLCSPGFAPAQTAAPVETSDLAVAQVRHALAEERALIAAKPTDPEPHVLLAYTLCDAGMGAEARQAAAEAVRVAPRSAYASGAQGWVLRHNSVGVDFGRGMDFDGSLKSYTRALELDPGDLEIREGRANLLDHNRDGIEYGPGALLAQSIADYRYSKQHQSPKQVTTEENLGLALFYAGRYAEVLAEVKLADTSAKHQGLRLAATAALRGSAEAVALSREIGDEQMRKDALNLAAEGLWDRQLYTQAADLMTASLPDSAEGGRISSRIQLFTHLQPLKAEELAASDPRRPVQQLMVAMLQGSVPDTVLRETWSRHSYRDEAALLSSFKEQDQLAGIFSTLTRQTGLPRVVLSDLLFSRMRITATADPGAGTSVTVRGLGPKTLAFYVLPEDGAARIAAIGTGSSFAGFQALWLLAEGRSAAAAAVLNWRRSLEQPLLADDPLGGSVFLHLWPSGQPAGEQDIMAAAASLLQDPETLQTLLPRIVALRDSAGADKRKASLDLLLLSVYLQLRDAPRAAAVSGRLLQQFPDSATAVRLSGRTAQLAGDWRGWKALLAPRLEKAPTDRGLLLESASEAEAEGDFPRARGAYRTLLNSGKATPADSSMDAWLSLFAGTVDDEAIHEAQEASLSEGSRSFSSLHTLACLNAARGRTAEARQELLDAMASGHLEEPNSAIFLGFGMIFEQYGERAAAIAAYRKVIPPASGAAPDHAAVSSYAVAQIRLKALGIG